MKAARARPLKGDKTDWRTFSISGVRPDLQRNLRSAASANDRSLSAEISHRLETSFREDEIMARLDRIEAAVKALGALLISERRAA